MILNLSRFPNDVLDALSLLVSTGRGATCQLFEFGRAGMGGSLITSLLKPPDDIEISTMPLKV